jgi:hypothetical protein
MVQDSQASDWWRLTPDNTGSYVNGTWSQLASMPSTYGPLYFGSAVLPDGRVIVEGGEYNITNQQVETNKGAIYQPKTNTWSVMNPPSGWSEIGDASTVVLPNGVLMLGNCCNAQQALLDASNLTWTITGKGKADDNSEEGWTLLGNNLVLTVDVLDQLNTERYSYQLNGWGTAGKTPVNLAAFEEMGPAVLRPDGTVFATGASGLNAIYTPDPNIRNPGTWVQGPSFPVIGGKQLDAADAPAALLPDGNVLCDVSPGAYNAPTYFFEFNGSTLTQVPGPPNAPVDSSFYGRMLVLPTGQILFTDGSDDVEVYNANGGSNPAWAPAITSVASTLVHGKTYVIKGTQFNGLSQGAVYGDDAQMATNYPLVRITNNATGHVRFARTHNHSWMGVASGNKLVGTGFDVPANIETGASSLEVVANGIASGAVSVTIQ